MLNNDVGMFFELNRSVYSQRIQYDPNSFPPRKLESRNEIPVSSHDDNGANHIAESKASNVHTDPHIDALLLYIQFEIGITQVTLLCDYCLAPILFESPTILSEKTFAKPQCDIRYEFEPVIKSLSVIVSFGPGQIPPFTADWESYIATQRWSIIVINSQ